MTDCGGDQRKSRHDWKRKERQCASEGIIKKVKGDMPSGNLPINGNLWQTTEAVKLENKGTSK